MGEPAYDEIGHGYAAQRRADPLTAGAIAAALGDAAPAVRRVSGALPLCLVTLEWST
jgi:hypothetical protein